MTKTTELPTPREVIIDAMAMEVETAHEKHVIAYSINRVKTYGWKLPAGSTGQESEPKSMAACIEASDAFDEILRKQLQDAFELGQAAGQATAAQCLHQIQEPAAAEQAAWHASLDEGRAQAAPAAVAVPDEQEQRKLKGLMLEVWACAKPHPDVTNEQLRGILGRCLPYIRALAATPAADEQDLDFVISPDALRAEDLILVPRGVLGAACHAINKKRDAPKTLAELRRYAFSYLPPAAAPVVLPEPAGRTTSHDGEFYWDNHLVGLESRFGAKLYTEQQVRALLATATGLPAQAVPAFCHVAYLKLKSLQERGYQITGYALEKPVEGAQPERGFINHGGFVGWWWDGQSPQAKADARDAERYRWVKQQAEFFPLVMDGTGLLCAEVEEAEEAIDAAIAAAKGE